MSTNYQNLKMRYYANLGIQPQQTKNLNQNNHSQTSSPPTFFHHAQTTSCSSSDNENLLNVADIFSLSDHSSDDLSSSSSLESFEIQLDDIFELEEEPNFTGAISIPVDIPERRMSQSCELATEDTNQTFRPPHLLSNHSTYSSLQDYKYHKNRATAKNAF